VQVPGRTRNWLFGSLLLLAAAHGVDAFAEVPIAIWDPSLALVYLPIGCGAAFVAVALSVIASRLSVSVGGPGAATRPFVQPAKWFAVGCIAWSVGASFAVWYDREEPWEFIASSSLIAVGVLLYAIAACWALRRLSLSK
jgi:hypothetical protein